MKRIVIKPIESAVMQFRVSADVFDFKNTFVCFKDYVERFAKRIIDFKTYQNNIIIVKCIQMIHF